MADAKQSNIPTKSISLLDIPDGKVPGAVNTSFRLVATYAAQILQAPGYPVGHAGVVRIRAHNGMSGNVGTVYVATNMNALTNSGGLNLAPGVDPIPAGVEITYPCDNTAQIFVLIPNAGDGVQISVKGVI
jgi:hypothetical protein